VVVKRSGGDWDSVGINHKTLHVIAYSWHNKLLARTKGLEHIPRTGGFLFAGNHTSWWDPILMSATMERPVHYLAKHTVGGNAFSKWFFFQSGGAIPVDRNAKNPEAYQAAIAALRAGQIVGIFPEGTRYVGQLGPAKTGVARMALESGVPVVPAAFATDKFWPPGKKVPDLRETAYVNVGAPRTFQGDPHDSDLARKVTDDIMGDIARLLDEAKAARDRKEKWPRVRGIMK
jgi:1-acyl-sn-glycerol-3-phosphate acyltransferase